MKSTIYTYVVSVVLSVILFMGCKSSMVIEKVDYSQSIESVITPNEDGLVKDIQRGLTFNIKPLQYAETQDTSEITTKQVRYIRGQEGYYYITAPNYKNVYVMAPEKGKLQLKEKLAVSESGIEKPALNQRASHVQLLSRTSGDSWKLYPEKAKKNSSQIVKKEGN
ncbi:hypothetical protein [Fodinibius halophilus]|uniref:Uncharacterized protein n=1 Tax=Fodinibius halophilus TaxID=1736908 RepID=A0A6M1TKQ1_9BACT|nr:hypothetical protein [Fodinibius halophilus]NGP89060.1 hypothetical protein [Fodinibius halophilus]